MQYLSSIPTAANVAAAWCTRRRHRYQQPAVFTGGAVAKSPGALIHSKLVSDELQKCQLPLQEAQVKRLRPDSRGRLKLGSCWYAKREKELGGIHVSTWGLGFSCKKVFNQCAELLKVVGLHVPPRTEE